MATDYEIRPNWLPIVLTSAVTLVLPLLFGWSNGWIAAVSLLPLVIAAWLPRPIDSGRHSGCRDLGGLRDLALVAGQPDPGG